jgi:hypothetical protein
MTVVVVVVLRGEVLGEALRQDPRDDLVGAAVAATASARLPEGHGFSAAASLFDLFGLVVVHLQHGCALVVVALVATVLVVVVVQVRRLGVFLFVEDVLFFLLLLAVLAQRRRWAE